MIDKVDLLFVKLGEGGVTLFCHGAGEGGDEDESRIYTLRDYSKPSHEGYRNTMELPLGNNVDHKNPQRYPDVPKTSWRISIRSVDSFQGLTLETPLSWHRPLAPSPNFYDHVNPVTRQTIDQLAGANGTKSYPVGIVKDVEVHIGKLKLLNDFYVINMKKDPKTLVGRGFLATANAVIDCRMAKIVVGEGITRSVFGVKGVDLGEEEAPYWTALGKRESYKPRPRSEGVCA
nr:hypothetical protein [Tanacetum cinerariifolium]